jgi:hypothetical protein
MSNFKWPYYESFKNIFMKGKFWNNWLKYLNELCKLLQDLKSLMWNNTPQKINSSLFFGLKFVIIIQNLISQSYEYIVLDHFEH